MFCAKCGKEMKEEDKFCSYCGADVNGVLKASVKKEREITKESVKSYLIPSIIAIFICLPLAIPAILYSLKAEKKLKLNEIKEAYDASRAACGWMSAAYISIVAMIPVIAILAAIALPAFGSQIKKSKDQKAVAVMGTMRANLNMTIADLEGNAPEVDNIKNIITGGEVRAINNNGMKTQVRGLGTDIEKMIEFESDGSKGYVGYIVCGSAGDINGMEHNKIPFKYVVNMDEYGNIEARFEFEKGYTNSRGRDWSEY